MGRSPKRNLIGKTALFQKSIELQIPVERLLAGYVMEQLAVKLSESERAQCLLLKNPDVLGLSGLAKNGSHRLHYVYVKRPGEVFSKADFAAFLKQTIKWETQTNIEWSWRSHTEEMRLFVELAAVLDDMRMPVELVIDPVEGNEADGSADVYPVRLIMENNKICKINIYSEQESFFDDLGEILTKLELISDMAVYESVYETLGEHAFEGRQFQNHLEHFCAEHEIVMDEIRYAQIERYQNYPYMKKKWNAYLKKRRRTGPSWEEVYGRFWSFLMPPWSAALQGFVYLGSWIPDLGRYLD